MKKLFTIDDFMVAFISALGYGLGAEIPMLLGWPGWASTLTSMAAGMAMEAVISKIVFSKPVQKKKANRIVTFCLIFLVFLLCQLLVSGWSKVSLFEYVMEEHRSVILFPILGFVLNMVIRWYKVRKVRRQYGDGSEGFVFSLRQEDVEAVNRENQPVEGEYDTACAVRTRTGTFVGVKAEKSLFFSGIPYAMPPVGERRWKAPEALPASEAVFEAKYPGASALQVEFEGSILKHHRQSEDCLTLNICIACDKEEGKKKKPVLVLFHHGDFSYGGSADPLMYGDSFSKAHPDIVLVSFNYRLGILGFIDFSNVPGGEAYPDALNLGLLDQIAALRWIRENIAAFGGDPDKITVMGFESGATSISLLAACEEARGLFRRAFVFFGSPATVYDTPEPARDLAQALMKETATSTMAELRQLSGGQLKEAAQKLWINMAAPTCDGKLIPADVYDAYQKGAAAGIEFIVGIPSNERQIYRSTIGAQNYEAFMQGSFDVIMKSLDGENAGAVADYVQAQTASMPELEAKAKVFEQMSALYMYRSAMKLSAGGNRVHLLYWNVKPLIENLGSGTVDVAAAFFGNSDASQMYGNVMDSDLSEILQSFLTKFIRGEALRLYNNEIKGVGAVEWKKFPKALLVSNNALRCEAIADRLTEIKGLLDFVSQ